MSPEDKKQVLLIGPPNSGKTTLFNWLTGFKNKTVNYPGSTVLIAQGLFLKKFGLPPALVKDTPGLYSLSPLSEDEEITKKSLLQSPASALILALDAGRLEIQLPLFFQLKETGLPIVIALTMWDKAAKNTLDLKKLEKLLEAPIAPIKGQLGAGAALLAEKLKPFLERPARKPLQPKERTEEQLEEHLNKSKKIIKKALIPSNRKKENIFQSEKWDRFFLHPKFGFLFFTAIMLALFSSIFWLAAPFMDLIDLSFIFLADISRQALAAYPIAAAFLSQGLISSLGAAIIFVPQIFILFCGISLLEDSGYLARAAALMDGPMSRIGLSGRSFIPFLAAKACAVPAVMAARNIPSKRERFMAFFALPFMTCSARLPVYALLLSFLFYKQPAWKPGLALSFIYIASFFLGMAAVFFLNLLLKKEESNSFILDIPIYQKPSLKKILQNAGRRSRHFIVNAAPIITAAGIIIWAFGRIPFYPELPPAEQLNQSWLAGAARLAEPLWSAMGADWRIGAALIAAFAAREVFVPALALLFSAGGSASLLSGMKQAAYANGDAVFTAGNVTALIVFFMISMQCLSTTSVIYKESGSFKLAFIQLISLNLFAFIAAAGVYQLSVLF